jgi:hypothetical protein
VGGHDLEPAGEAVEIAGDPELLEQRRGVAVDPLANQVVALEDEDREEGLLEAPAGGRKASQRPVGAARDRSITTASSARRSLTISIFWSGKARWSSSQWAITPAPVVTRRSRRTRSGVLEGRECRVVVAGVLGLTWSRTSFTRLLTAIGATL